MFRLLIYKDIKQIQRDRMLLLFIGLLLVIMLFSHLLLENLLRIFTNINHSIPLYYSAVILFIIAIIGTINGFLFLEERVQKTYLLFQISSSHKIGYVSYRLLVTFITCYIIVYTYIITIPSPFQLNLNQPSIVILSLMFSLVSVSITIFLNYLSTNQLEGFVRLKIISFIYELPVLVYLPYFEFLLKSKIKYVFYLIPTYWPVHAIINQSSSTIYLDSLFMIGVYFFWYCVCSIINTFKR